LRLKFENFVYNSWNFNFLFQVVAFATFFNHQAAMAALHALNVSALFRISCNPRSILRLNSLILRNYCNYLFWLLFLGVNFLVPFFSLFGLRGSLKVDATLLVLKYG
jgi:hypothetical protein